MSRPTSSSSSRPASRTARPSRSWGRPRSRPPDRARIVVEVEDGRATPDRPMPLPVRVIVTASDGTHPDGSGRGVYSDGRFFAEAGFSVEVPPGRTTIALRSGPDYEPLEMDVEAKAGSRGPGPGPAEALVRPGGAGLVRRRQPRPRPARRHGRHPDRPRVHGAPGPGGRPELRHRGRFRPFPRRGRAAEHADVPLPQGAGDPARPVRRPPEHAGHLAADRAGGLCPARRRPAARAADRRGGPRPGRGRDPHAPADAPAPDALDGGGRGPLRRGPGALRRRPGPRRPGERAALVRRAEPGQPRRGQQLHRLRPRPAGARRRRATAGCTAAPGS